MSVLDWLLTGTWTIGGHAVLVREIVGNGFGLASALLGMARRTWAWPVGIVGNIVLFTVFTSGFLAGDLPKPQQHDLWGQAGRQVFFLLVSAYGWWRWMRVRRSGGAPDGGAIVPRWAGAGELRAMIVAGVAMMLVFHPVLTALDSWGPLADAWILTGSILATYGMARGYVEFWWIWVGVDIVGVPLAWSSGYYPSAIMYSAYGLFCLLGFFTWWRAERRLSTPPSTTHDREVAHA